MSPDFWLGIAHAETVAVELEMGKTTVEQNPQRVVVLGIGPLDALDSFGIHPVAVTKTPHLPVYLEAIRQ
ncbi:hypothetical protein P4S72_15830 [Vibrio sp. PP-XX7]